MRNCGEHFECVDGTCQERLERLPESTGTSVAFQGNEDEEPINIVNSLITSNLTKSDEKSNLNSSAQEDLEVTQTATTTIVGIKVKDHRNKLY